MRFSIVLIAAMAQVASATFGHQYPKPNDPKPDCGTTTIREVCKTATKTSYSHFPTVTQTITQKKNACEVVKTTTKYSVHTSVVKVTVAPTITSTFTAPKKTVTASACVSTVTYCPPKHYKRHFLEERLTDDDEEDVQEEVVEEDEYAGLTNAERIRRGLPLAKPVDKRTWGYDHGNGHGHGGGKPQPPKAGPSCVPKTVREETTKTITKSVTPTQYVTSTKCGYTQTVLSTTVVSDCKTETQTVVGNKATTVFKTVTPTSTKHVQFTTTVCPSKRY